MYQLWIQRVYRYENGTSTESEYRDFDSEENARAHLRGVIRVGTPLSGWEITDPDGNVVDCKP